MLAKARIVLADDNRAILDRVVKLLGTECCIVATATDGQQAIEVTRTLRPDVLVLDISMPNLNGFEVARRLQDDNVDVRVVFLTVNEDPECVHEALDVGALGYVAKPRIASDLLFAIREACAGRSFTSPSVGAVTGPS